MAKNEGCNEEGLQGQDSATLTAHRLSGESYSAPLPVSSLQSYCVPGVEAVRLHSYRHNFFFTS